MFVSVDVNPQQRAHIIDTAKQKLRATPMFKRYDPATIKKHLKALQAVAHLTDEATARVHIVGEELATSLLSDAELHAESDTPAMVDVDAEHLARWCAENGRKRKRLPDHITNVLMTWFIAHQDHPYPTKEEKELLMAQTGLNTDQLRNWLTNTRKRHWTPVRRGAQPRSALAWVVQQRHQHDSPTSERSTQE